MLETFLQDPESSSKADPNQAVSGVVIGDEWKIGDVYAGAGCLSNGKDNLPLSKARLLTRRQYFSFQNLLKIMNRFTLFTSEQLYFEWRKFSFTLLISINSMDPLGNKLPDGLFVPLS